MFNLKYRPHYFSHHLNREVEEVYWHAILNGLALSLVFIFEPIYLYSLGYSFTQILWFYVQVYVWYSLLISFGAKFASRFGYKRAILISNFFYILYWVVLFSISTQPTFFYLAPLLFAGQKSLFWPAYDAEAAIAMTAAKAQEGREVGVLFSINQLAFIIGPFLGGVLSSYLGFQSLFIAAAALLLISVYPLFKSPEVHSVHRFRFQNLWAVFREHKSNFFGYWGNAEDLMFQSLWPVYMFTVVASFLSIGLITTVATLVGTLLMLYVGKLSDQTDKRKLIRQGSIFYGLTWIFRFLGPGLGGVLAFDALTKAGKDISNVPITVLTFERAGSRGPDHAIAYSVFFEFSLSIGKIITALLGIAILGTSLGIMGVFALAGILTMFYAFLK